MELGLEAALLFPWLPKQSLRASEWPEWPLSSSFGTHCDEADSFLTWQSYRLHPESLLLIGLLYGGLGSAASDPISLVRIELSWV